MHPVAHRSNLARVPRRASPWLLILIVFGLSAPQCSVTAEPRGAPAPATSPMPAPSVAPASGFLFFEPTKAAGEGASSFVSRGSGRALVLSEEGATLSLSSAGHAEDVGLRFVGARRVAPAGREPLAAKANYLVGQRSDWRHGVPLFGRVRYESLYPGIDVDFRLAGGFVEYDLLVAPGASVEAVRLRFEGAMGVGLDAAGRLQVDRGARRLIQRAPVAYQEVAGERRIVGSRYQVLEGGDVAILLDDYDRHRPLVIDPILEWETDLSETGTLFDVTATTAIAPTTPSIALDGAGNVYVVGHTTELALPVTVDAFDDECGTDPGGTCNRDPSNPDPIARGPKGDVYLIKLDPTGTNVLYATYIGGSESDTATDVEVDAAGHVHIVGTTNSNDFPAVNAEDSSVGGSCNPPLDPPFPIVPGFRCTDAFLSKLLPDGSGFVYSTVWGGDENDAGMALELDATGNAYIAGFGESIPIRPFPVPPSLPMSGSGRSVMVAKFDASGAALFSTRIGSTGSEQAEDLDIDDAGNVYVVGHTSSFGFPVTPGAFDTTIEEHEAFIFKMNAGFDGLGYVSFLGGVADDWAYEVEVMRGNGAPTGPLVDGIAVVAGATRSTDFPVLHGQDETFSPAPGCSNDGFPNIYCPEGFVTIVNQLGSSIIHSTLVGGNSEDFVSSLHAEGTAAFVGGNPVLTADVWVSGRTRSTDFPSLNAFQPAISGAFPEQDAFVTRLRWVGNTPSTPWSTFFGVYAVTEFFTDMEVVGDGVFLAGRQLTALVQPNPDLVIKIAEDSDDDGVSVGQGDCNDFDGDVYPGAPELCDLKDNDCNTLVDDGIPDVYTGSSVGECRPRIESCVAGSMQVIQTQIFPSTEVCDSLDNDCNTVADDGIADILTGSDVGECQPEIQSCVGGSFQVVQMGTGPTSEVCDGFDNDCDASIDNGIADIVTGTDVGVCQVEIQSCIGGALQIVQPGVGPTSELCDALDNDCNGVDDVTQGVCNTPPAPGQTTFTDPLGNASLIFPDVATGGDTTVEVITCDLLTPNGYTLNTSGTCYGIESTADSSSGYKTVCIDYPLDLMPPPTVLFKCESAGVGNCCAISFDATVNTCGQDASFQSLNPVPPPPDPQVGWKVCVSVLNLSEFGFGTYDAGVDSDFDSVPDVFDNCPSAFDPLQTDNDVDGRGDVCDNCAFVANGPEAGTCIGGDDLLAGTACIQDSECGHGGFCSRQQEDANSNGLGDACDVSIVPAATPDVFETPACYFGAGCTPGDFPFDWGVVETFNYDLAPGAQVSDALLRGTWGGSLFAGSAPVEVYLEGLFITECLEPDPCWLNASTVDWNGGAGFLLSDLGVDFSDPGVRALFEDGSAELSFVQTDLISVNVSNLRLIVFAPEPGAAISWAAGALGLIGLARRRRRRTARAR